MGINTLYIVFKLHCTALKKKCLEAPKFLIQAYYRLQIFKHIVEYCPTYSLYKYCFPDLEPTHILCALCAKCVQPEEDFLHCTECGDFDVCDSCYTQHVHDKHEDYLERGTFPEYDPYSVTELTAEQQELAGQEYNKTHMYQWYP